MNQFTLTEQILAYWKQTDAFKQSIEQRSEHMPWKFYDGPPFTSGDPHYGHLLQSTVKDTIPRWMTMRGYRVPRKRWRDCHGIPAENFVNKKLWLSWKKDIGTGPDAKISLQDYIEACRTMVGEVNDKRSWFVDHLWRWVDMEHAYFTMHKPYMESVMSVFADLYNKNLIYKWFKVLGYSRALWTALSNSEIAEWYMDRQDPAITIALTLKDATKKQEKYETTPDGFTKVWLGIVRDDDARILMVYDIKHDTWMVPGGKVEKGESFADAVTRELFEEVGLEVLDTSYLGANKAAFGNQLWQLWYVACEVTWELTNNEPQKQWALAWVEKIPYDNDLWYALRVDIVGEWTNIEANSDIIQKDFADFLNIIDKHYALESIADASFSLLAWTTTPWTLPSNMFGAVHKDICYAVVYDCERQATFVIAQKLLGHMFKNVEQYRLLYVLSGSHFIGLSYEPLFSYYYDAAHIDPVYHAYVHRIVHADFVSEDSGTGIAHEAPAFGEDDYMLVAHLTKRDLGYADVSQDKVFPAEQAAVWLFNPVDDHGEFTTEVSDFAGRNVIEANKDIIAHLKQTWSLVKHDTIQHSYPHCPRTKEPMIYRAMESWFVKEEQLKEKTLPLAEKVAFVPTTVEHRFKNGLASAPDRNISRSRFWWAPLPVWECQKEWCCARRVFGSIAEIEAASGQKVVDLHRPYIDEITIPCPWDPTCLMKRIPEVLDCWFESGSMPYGQDHYVRQQESTWWWQEFTADFIAEWLDQTRGWFRSLHVLWAAYTDTIVYRNVLTTGLILAEDGKKMSKSLKNYPDPRKLLEQYGADAFRLYVLASPVVRGEPLRFAEKGVEQMLKDFVIPLQNVWNFFTMYAAVDQWTYDGTEVYFMRHAEANGKHRSAQLTDAWLYSLQDQECIEHVVRINPDVIVVSPILRAEQTWKSVQSIVQTYLGKEVPIQSCDWLCTPNLTWDTAAQWYAELMKLVHGKKALVIGHYNRFWIKRSYAFGKEHKEVKNNMEQWYCPLENTEIVKLPTVRLTNELDQWILSELYTMLQTLDNAMGQYDLEPATKILIQFMDKLTNWWLRRSRRRFWSEGVWETMSEDKKAAYRTLREVLSIYASCAAPFAPFVTEWVRQSMKDFVAQGVLSRQESIHLHHWPLASSKYINTSLSDEIAHVRKIIKGAMYLRAKHQIKVKQPLQTLKVTF